MDGPAENGRAGGGRRTASPSRNLPPGRLAGRPGSAKCGHLLTTAVRSGPIVVVPYDPSWPAAFRDLRDAIRRSLGKLACEVEHIGSTAVPGLCAKPRIDVDVVLPSGDDIAEAVELLKRTDRDYHGDPHGAGMWTFTSRRGRSPGHRIYLCAPDTAAHLKRILFRDHLRANPEVAAAYGALKRRLVIESGGVWEAYTEGKSSFVADVVERATSSEPDGAPAAAPARPATR